MNLYGVLGWGLVMIGVSGSFAGTITLTAGSTATISPGETVTVTCSGSGGGGSTSCTCDVEVEGRSSVALHLKSRTTRVLIERFDDRSSVAQNLVECAKGMRTTGSSQFPV